MGPPGARWAGILCPNTWRGNVSIRRLVDAQLRCFAQGGLIFMLSRGRTLILSEGAARYKVCECGNRFPVEFNSRGQMTSRKLCDLCREKRQKRNADELPNTQGVPRCCDCFGLVGLEWGTITHLDHNGRCPSCAKWYQKRVAREAAEKNGVRFVGGMRFEPARYPTVDYLRRLR
jgi:hypothetical protein